MNPYDIDQTAEAIRAALEMQSEEKQLRMQRMRKSVRENNVYRWAGTLIGELCDVRLDNAESSPTNFGGLFIAERSSRRAAGSDR